MLLISAFCFIFGTLIGSFLNVCAYRLPRQKSIIAPRSYCPQCKTPISWYDNIPILSYILLKGRCRHCQKKISIRYPLVEFLCGILSLLTYKKLGLSLEGLIFFFFWASLLLISIIDIEFQIVPDEISLPGIILGWIFSFWNPIVSLWSAFLGSLVGAGSLYLIAEFYYFLTKREGLGGGDLKLLAFIGSFLGLTSLWPILLISSLIGIIVGLALAFWQKVKEKRLLVIPFGPFLSLGAFFYWYFYKLWLNFFSFILIPK